MNTLSLNEIVKEMSEPISPNQIELVRVKLANNPTLPQIYMDLPVDGHRPNIFLSINDGVDELHETRIYLVPELPLTKIPLASITMADVLEAPTTAYFDSHQQFFECACAVLVKRIAKLKINRPTPWNNDVEITLSVAGFKAEAICSISELTNFIDPEPMETDDESAARFEAMI